MNLVERYIEIAEELEADAMRAEDAYKYAKDILLAEQINGHAYALSEAVKKLANDDA